jgi:hypothetical protein
MRIPISVLAMLVASPLYAVVDPFGSENTKWETHISERKPYQIEFAFAELPYNLPLSADGSREVTESFLNAARKVVVAASSNDLGKIEREDGIVIFYRTKEEKGYILLSFSVTTMLSSVCEITSDIVLPINKWVVLDGQTSRKVLEEGKAGTSVTLYYSLAIRIK